MAFRSASVFDAESSRYLSTSMSESQKFLSLHQDLLGEYGWPSGFRFSKEGLGALFPQQLDVSNHTIFCDAKSVDDLSLRACSIVDQLGREQPEGYQIVLIVCEDGIDSIEIGPSLVLFYNGDSIANSGSSGRNDRQ